MKRIARRGAFWGLGLVAMAMSSVTLARASTIHYVINNNAGMIAPFQNELVSIAGQFNYDTATGGVANFDVILTTKLEFSGTYTEAGFVAIVPGLGQPKIVFGGTGDNGIFYAIDLFLNGPDPWKLGDEVYDISFIDAGGSAAGGPNYTLLPADAMHRPTITALVGGEAPVPEPATWVFALTGGALVLLKLLPRARAKICSRQPSSFPC